MPHLIATGSVQLTEAEIDHLHEPDLEASVKHEMAKQLGRQIAESEVGLQKYIREGGVMWTQVVHVLSLEEYADLTRRASK